MDNLGEEALEKVGNEVGTLVVDNAPTVVEYIGKGANLTGRAVLETILKNTINRAKNPKQKKLLSKKMNNLRKLKDSGEPIRFIDVSKHDKDKVMLNFKKTGIDVALLGNGNQSTIAVKESDLEIATKLIEIVVRERLEKEDVEKIPLDKEITKSSEQTIEAGEKNTDLNNKRSEVEPEREVNNVLLEINPKDLEALKDSCKEFNIDLATFDKNGRTNIVIDSEEKAFVEKLIDKISTKRETLENTAQDLDSKIKSEYRERGISEIPADYTYDIDAENLLTTDKNKGTIEKNIEAAKEKSKNLSSHKENVAEKGTVELNNKTKILEDKVR